MVAEIKLEIKLGQRQYKGAATIASLRIGEHKNFPLKMSMVFITGKLTIKTTKTTRCI